MTSTISITYDGNDITNSVIFRTASFEAQLSAIPGQFSLEVKDPDQTLSFVTGKEIVLTLDGQAIYGGYLTMVRRTYAFPAADTTDPDAVKVRIWKLEGVDYNILFQKIVLRDRTNLSSLLPDQPVNAYDKTLIATLVANYIDAPAGFDLSSRVERVRQPIQLVDQKGFGEAAAAAANLPAPLIEFYHYMDPGTKWKDQMDEFARQCGTVYYINGSKQLIYRAVENLESKWGFSDIPNHGAVVDFADYTSTLNGAINRTQTTLVVTSAAGSPNAPFRMMIPNDIDGFEIVLVTAKAGTTFTITRGIEGSEVDTHASGTQVTALQNFQGAFYGFREVEIVEDATNIVNNALVWGGSAFVDPAGDTVFAEAENTASIAKHKRWQYGLVDFENVKTQAMATFRANQIVSGKASDADPGNGRGLVFPQWQVRLAWFGDQVPQIGGIPDHLLPGDLVTFHFRVMKDADWPEGLTILLPMRQVRISFVTLHEGDPYVRFDGMFGLQTTDPWTFWRYLLGRQTSISTAATVVSNSSTSTVYGAFGQFTPEPDPDGVTTVFDLPNNFGYIAGTEQIFLNQLLQRPGIEYTPSDPSAGEFEFASPPVAGDTLTILCRTTGT
jgi:hypothetical protein